MLIRCPLLLLTLGTLLPVVVGLPAQQPSTQPHWSTCFGGSNWDMATSLHRKQNGHLIVVGTTLSPDLPVTPGAFQTQLPGSSAAFAACIDPTQPAAQQLVWCTYLGGSGMDIPLDSYVDAQGVVTIVGLTDSPDFPMNAAMPGFQTTRNGPSDGFIARLDSGGSTLLYATYYGGSSHDRFCGVAVDAAGVLCLIGVTESLNLAGTSGTLFPNYRGGPTDAFVARIDPLQPPAAQLQWALYSGGPGFDGPRYSAIANNGGLGPYWEGALRRHFITVDTQSRLVVLQISEMSDPRNTTTGSIQPVGNTADFLLLYLDASGTSLHYGTYVGGPGQDIPYAMALHPAGGVVLAGEVTSTNMPVTANAFQPMNRGGGSYPSDGYLCWIDPWHGTGMQQLRYASYLGGNAGDEGFQAMAIDAAGTVTLVGDAIAGGGMPYPTTYGSVAQSAPSGQRCGAVVRLRMDGLGAADLVYSTLLGASWTVHQKVLLDGLGDAYVLGASQDIAYPTTQNALQPGNHGFKDVVITHLPLLPGGTGRHDIGLATPACGAPLFAATLGAPQAGNLAFALSATNAPPQELGFAVFGFGPPAGGPQQIANALLLVEPVAVTGLIPSDQLGFARTPLPMPPGVSPGINLQIQWGFLTNGTCPGSGPFATSERLSVTTL